MGSVLPLTHRFNLFLVNLVQCLLARVQHVHVLLQPEKHLLVILSYLSIIVKVLATLEIYLSVFLVLERVLDDVEGHLQRGLVLFVVCHSHLPQGIIMKKGIVFLDLELTQSFYLPLVTRQYILEGLMLEHLVELEGLLFLGSKQLKNGVESF